MFDNNYCVVDRQDDHSAWLIDATISMNKKFGRKLFYVCCGKYVGRQYVGYQHLGGKWYRVIMTEGDKQIIRNIKWPFTGFIDDMYTYETLMSMPLGELVNLLGFMSYTSNEVSIRTNYSWYDEYDDDSSDKRLIYITFKDKEYIVGYDVTCVPSYFPNVTHRGISVPTLYDVPIPVSMTTKSATAVLPIEHVRVHDCANRCSMVD